MRSLQDALLTTEPVQRVRIAQALLAMAMLAAAVAAMHYFAWVGVLEQAAVWWWTALSLLGMALAFLAIRSGWSRRLRDPSLTVPQMVYAITCGAVAYALLGAARGSVFLIVMVILMFGMFVATPRQIRLVSLYAVLLFGATMALMAWHAPSEYPSTIEIGHFIMVATMMPALSILAARLARMRQRARVQRLELKAALVRIRELATRDELTGLINRRHMLDLMDQEHQRCIRSGRTFCLAVFDLDHLKRINTSYGTAAGDDMLRAVAVEGLRCVRISDVLARWGGEEFVLMMSDTRAVLARGGVERLRERIAALRVASSGAELQLTCSVGLAEHHAGESVAQTLARADRALHEAKAQGHNRVVGPA